MPLLKKNSARKEKPQRPKETLPESIAGIASVLVVGLFILTFIVQHFEIPSRSMEKTLLVGDHVFVDRLTPTGKGPMSWLFPYRQLRRGDTAVFMTPNPADKGLYLVKRIIGVPGDRIRLHNGIVYLNGVRQNEPYVIRDGSYSPYRDEFPSALVDGIGQLAQGWLPTLEASIHNGELVVPPGHYFAMGDNRDNSLDSRYWGFVPQENVIGRPLFIFWSFDVPEENAIQPKPMTDRIASFLYTTLHFFTLTRWNRIFHLVH